jgi:hypothetical protein
MPAARTRREARERIVKSFFASLERIIPEDESVPLRGSTFLDFEKQVEQVRHDILPVVLEERAALDAQARAEEGGHCPCCGSDRVYLEKRETQPEVMGPHGPVMLNLQHCRCRCCGGSFSPSASGMGSAGGGSADVPGGGTPGAGDGGAAV